MHFFICFRRSFFRFFSINARDCFYTRGVGGGNKKRGGGGGGKKNGGGGKVAKPTKRVRFRRLQNYSQAQTTAQRNSLSDQSKKKKKKVRKNVHCRKKFNAARAEALNSCARRAPRIYRRPYVFPDVRAENSRWALRLDNPGAIFAGELDFGGADALAPPRD